MPIVAQSACVSYSPFPALPAPKIAGLLPAPPVRGLLGPGSAPVRQTMFQQQMTKWAAEEQELREFVAAARQRILAVRAELLREREEYRREVIHG